MRLSSGGLLLMAILAAGPAFGEEGGALPKGSDADGGKASAKTTAKAPKKDRNCFLDLTDPPGGNGHFTADGKSLYLLAQTGAATADPKPAKGKKKPAADAQDAQDDKDLAVKVKYTLFKINPKTRKSEALLSLDHRSNTSLLTYGEPVEALSAIAFAGQKAGCFEGPAAVVSISFAAEDQKAVQSSGRFTLVNTPNGRSLVDLKKGTILAMDTSTFQTKTARRVPAGERPLFFDPARKSLVTWHDSGEQRGLVAYATESDAKARRLAFKTGDRVLQNGGRFAAAHLDLMANTIEIQEVEGWSKTGKPGHFKLRVPPTYPVSTAGIDINFDMRYALVFGANFLAKQKWQRVLVFNYASGELLGAVSVTGTQYLNYAGIDPTGAYAVFEIRDMTTRRTVGAKVFNVAKKTFDDIELTLPK